MTDISENGWERAQFMVDMGSHRDKVQGWIKRGLGVAQINTSKWTVTHILSGTRIMPYFGGKDSAMKATEKALEVTVWDRSVLDIKKEGRKIKISLMKIYWDQGL